MKNIIISLLLLFTSLVSSQNYKYGKVSTEELEETSYDKDPSANAVILYSERKTNFEYEPGSGFFIKTEYFERIKIYNKEGYDYATKRIHLHYNTASAKEEALFIKATTYNLENGKIVKTKLKNSAIFEDKINKYNYARVFTTSNIKEGSVIEWKYIVKSPFFSMLKEVKLQADIPIKKIKVRMAIPEYFKYNTLHKGYLHIPITNKRKEQTMSFRHTTTVHKGFSGSVRETYTETVAFEEFISLIELDAIPAILDESYSGNIDNYKLGLLYELSYVDYPGYSIKTFSNTWTSIVKDIYKSEYFGNQLDKTKHFSEDLPNVLAGALSEKEKMLAIFQFVKSKIKWNGIRGFYSDEGTKKAYKEAQGNTADINLNLVAMLRSIGLEANPVLVSTVDHGIPMFPTRLGFNYVIVSVKFPEGSVLLDATDPYTTPNILPDKTLNFRGRIVFPDGDSKWIELFPKTRSVTRTTINVLFNQMGFEGNARTTNSNRYAYQYRKEVKNNNTESLISWIEEKLEDTEVLGARVSNLKNLNKDIIETIKFETDSYYEEIGDKIYITPLLYLQIKENPFKSVQREFPVFYNKPWAQVNTINISLPENYTVETIPEYAEFALPDDIGIFQSKIDQKGQVVTITTSFVINESVIAPANYQSLKEFYKLIIEKQAEKIVLVRR